MLHTDFPSMAKVTIRSSCPTPKAAPVTTLVEDDGFASVRAAATRRSTVSSFLLPSHELELIRRQDIRHRAQSIPKQLRKAAIHKHTAFSVANDRVAAIYQRRIPSHCAFDKAGAHFSYLRRAEIAGQDHLASIDSSPLLQSHKQIGDQTGIENLA